MPFGATEFGPAGLFYAPRQYVTSQGHLYDIECAHGSIVWCLASLKLAALSYEDSGELYNNILPVYFTCSNKTYDSTSSSDLTLNTMIKTRQQRPLLLASFS